MAILQALLNYLVPLMLTIALEASAAALLFRYNKQEQRALLLCNLLTNPVLNLLLLVYLALAGVSAPLLVIIVLEVAVWLSEAYLMRRFVQTPLRKSYLLPMLAINAVSYACGLILNFILS